jgi:hypothetical protein
MPRPRWEGQSWGAFSITRLGSTLVVVGGDCNDDAGPERTVAYSLDQGATWNLAAGPPGGFRSAVAFLDRNTLLTVGTGGEDVSTDQGGREPATSTSTPSSSMAPPGPSASSPRSRAGAITAAETLSETSDELLRRAHR